MNSNTLARIVLGLFLLSQGGCTSPQHQTSERGPASQQDGTAELNPEIAKRIGDVFEKVMLSRKETPIKRAVFLKPHACARGILQVSKNLAPEFRVGLFAQKTPKNVWVRISSDTVPKTSDSANSTIGFSVKVLDVPGRKILPSEEEFKTQDFLLQNHHVFFVDTALDFLNITENFFSDEYLNKNLQTKAILKDMEKPVENVLGSNYWSTTPYKFGTEQFAKYKVIPCKKVSSEPANKQPNYLRERMQRDLIKSPACFEFQVQIKKEQMPLDQATVEWDEKLSVPKTVATITLPAQNISLNDKACENMAFTAWHTLPEHRPVGSINQARGLIYKRLSDKRRKLNSLPIAEPQMDSTSQIR